MEPSLPAPKNRTLFYFLLLLLILPLAIIATQTPIKTQKRAEEAPLTPIPTPPPSGGSYQIILNPNTTSINCYKDDPNCYLQVGYQAINQTDKPLYNTTIWTDDYKKVLSYIGFDGQWTQGRSTTSRIVQPGETAISTLVKVVPLSQTGTYEATIYIDGQHCKTWLNPPDCIWTGGTSHSFYVHVVDNPIPSHQPITPTPRPSYTPTPTPLPTPTPILKHEIGWVTQWAGILADDFYIKANGQKFYGEWFPELNSDPADSGDPDYTTLEAKWRENGKEMRLNIYFRKNSTSWWPTEIRTYNGAYTPSWLYYPVSQFSPTLIGQNNNYRGDLVIKSTNNQGELFLKNPVLMAFQNYNVPPKITSQSLVAGRWLSYYFATIEGEDQNINDNLSMWISGLPAGLTNVSCKKNFDVASNKKKIVCYLQGRPLRTGLYQVLVTLSDGRGGTDQKTFPLRISAFTSKIKPTPPMPTE